MAIQPTQPQSIGGVLDTSFQLYKASVAKVWPLSLLLAISGSLPFLYLIVKGGNIGTDPMAAVALLGDGQYWLTNLLVVLISLVAMAALFVRTNAIGVDSETSMGDALQFALGRFLLLFANLILFSIALMIGFVLLIIPGFILMVSLMLSFSLVVLERKGPFEALVGSHNLVWGNWWRTTAILTVGFIILFVLYLAVSMLLSLTMPIVGLRFGDPFLYALISSSIISMLITLIATPYYISLLLAIYWDLKLRKEGGDLAARVGALGTA
jgi:hypothetical protein